MLTVNDHDQHGTPDMLRTIVCILIASIVSACTPAGPGRLDVRLLQPTEWDGKLIPGGQICRQQGGLGATPPLYVRNIPPGTNVIVAEFNDANNLPLSYDGGLGKIGFKHDGSRTAWLLPVPGETKDLPPHAFIEKPTRSLSGRGSGYMPPCSGGKGHTYYAEVKAINRSGEFDNLVSTVLATGTIILGIY